MIHFLSLALATGILLACGRLTETELVQVHLGRATVIGNYDSSTRVDAFLGIKYANSARFEHATMVDYQKKGMINATVHAPACSQITNCRGYERHGVAEDCLYLEIYRPHPNRFFGSLPVLVWIHGGFGYFGAANRFTGYKFVNQSMEIDMPIILVAINYRLAAWGFLGGKEASLHEAVNLGLYDARTALEWVQNHIGCFGGDKTKVTLAGISFGAIQTHLHHLDEKTELFRAAIMSSGNAYSLPVLETSYYQDKYDALVTSTGCNATADTFGCIKTVDPETFQRAVDYLMSDERAYSTRPWWPVIDGGIIPNSPTQLFSQGKFAKKPFIHGSVLDEGSFYVKHTLMETIDDMWAFFETDYLNKGSTWLSNKRTKEKMLELYPADEFSFGTGAQIYGSEYGSSFKRAAAIYGDVRFQAPRRKWFSDAMSHGVEGWAYQFSQTTPGEWAGVPHVADLPYYSGEIPKSLPDHYNLAKELVSRWIAFTHNMDPNLDGFTNWPSYGPERNLMNFVINNTTVIPDTYREEAIAYINSIQDQFGHGDFRNTQPLSFWSMLGGWRDLWLAIPFAN